MFITSCMENCKYLSAYDLKDGLGQGVIIEKVEIIMDKLVL